MTAEGTRIPGLRTAWRIVVAVVGGTVTLVGIGMLVLPGPGLLVLAAGIGILATEFVWAGWFLRRAREAVSSLRNSTGRGTGAARGAQ